ncbi:MAG TPA: RNA polymerase sigma factor FliA [Steroidobacteraceae bacterium]|nr:RNA polymerase sigma factor FliA [Steroidobacteraceae bacterium]
MIQISRYTEAAAVDPDALVLQHAELVKRIAYHLAGRLPSQVDVDDLIQAGMLGLLEASANFAPDRGATFETYAGIRIRGAMLDTLRKLDWAPRSVHRKARAAAEALREVERELGAAASDAAVAARLGVSIDEYQRIVRDAASCRLLSLDELTEGDEASGRIVDSGAGPLGEVTDAAMRKALARAIGDLPEREKLVMSLYYEQELNLKEIGAVLGVTESRVCQLHGQALARLRPRLRDWRDAQEDGA